MTIPALTLALSSADKWMGMTIAMGLALAGALTLPAVRRRLKPSGFGVTAGIGAGLLLYGLSALTAAVIFALNPAWESTARILYSWREGHSALFIGLTLPMIVLAEEALWRGVVAQYLVERCGKMTGIVVAAGIYTLAHWAAFNPLMLFAAFACGIFWGLLYVVTDDLVAPTVSHLLWDVLLLFVAPVVSLPNS